MAPPGWYDDPIYGNHNDCWRRSWRTCIIDGREIRVFPNDFKVEVVMAKRKAARVVEQARQLRDPEPAPGYTSEAGRSLNYSAQSTSTSIFDVISRSLVERKTFYAAETAKIDEALSIIGDSTKVRDLKRLLDSLNLG